MKFQLQYKEKSRVMEKGWYILLKKKGFLISDIFWLLSEE